MANAQLSYNTVSVNGGYLAGTTATYSCNESAGYTYTSGSSERICQPTGNWNGEPVICSNYATICILFEYLEPFMKIHEIFLL